MMCSSRFEVEDFAKQVQIVRTFTAQVPLLEDKPELKVASSSYCEAGILLSGPCRDVVN